MFSPVVVVAVLAACSVAPSPGAASASQGVSALPSPEASASPTAEPTPDDRPLQGLLPSDFRGTEAHTFAVGQDMLERLAAAIGVVRADLQAAYASDHGPAFVQMYALRAAGRGPQELLDALPDAAFPGAPPGVIIVEPGQLGDRQVTVITEPSRAASLGSFYAFVDGGTLIVAQALAEPVAEAAFDELPPPSQTQTGD